MLSISQIVVNLNKIHKIQTPLGVYNDSKESSFLNLLWDKGYAVR